MSGFNPDPTPQFAKAEYVGTAGNDHCRFCNKPISSSFYRVNAAMACSECAKHAETLAAPSSHSDFMRAVLYGVGAAIAGLALYAAFEIMTGITIGYASLAVGWMIAKAMLKGSNGTGGRRYQITAALLTYFAVAMAAIPVVISDDMKRPSHQVTERAGKSVSPQDLADEQKQLEQDPRQPSKAAPERPANQQPAASEPPAQSDSKPPSTTSPLRAILGLAFFGLASPFLELIGNPVGGGIGIVILLIGIRIAWRMTEGNKINVSGPFEPSKSPA